MSNQFTGTGNIGQAPALRTVKVGSEDRSVADLRIFFDRSIPQDDGSFEDGGGFWLTVTVWGSHAETVVKLMSKGMRVHVTGQLRLVSWDDDGEARADLRLTAERLSIDPICLDSVQVRKRNSQTTDINGNGQASMGGHNPDYAVDHTFLPNLESTRSSDDVHY